MRKDTLSQSANGMPQGEEPAAREAGRGARTLLPAPVPQEHAAPGGDVRETKKTRIDGVHEARAGRRDVVQASCLASWRGAPKPSEAPPSSPLVRREFLKVHLIRGCLVERCLSQSSRRRRVIHGMGRSLRGVRSLGPCAVRTLPQGWRGHNGGHSTRTLSERRWRPCSMPRERRRLYPQEDKEKGKGHHGRRETPATVRGEPRGVRTPEAPAGVSPIYPKSAAIAAARSQRIGNSAPTAGHGWPRTAQAAATRCHRPVRMPAPGVAWPYHRPSPKPGHDILSTGAELSDCTHYIASR